MLCPPMSFRYYSVFCILIKNKYFAKLSKMRKKIVYFGGPTSLRKRIRHLSVPPATTLTISHTGFGEDAADPLQARALEKGVPNAVLRRRVHRAGRPTALSAAARPGEAQAQDRLRPHRRPQRGAALADWQRRARRQSIT